MLGLAGLIPNPKIISLLSEIKQSFRLNKDQFPIQIYVGYRQDIQFVLIQ